MLNPQLNKFNSDLLKPKDDNAVIAFRLTSPHGRFNNNPNEGSNAEFTPKYHENQENMKEGIENLKKIINFLENW